MSSLLLLKSDADSRCCQETPKTKTYFRLIWHVFWGELTLPFSWLSEAEFNVAPTPAPRLLASTRCHFDIKGPLPTDLNGEIHQKYFISFLTSTCGMVFVFLFTFWLNSKLRKNKLIFACMAVGVRADSWLCRYCTCIRENHSKNQESFTAKQTIQFQF